MLRINTRHNTLFDARTLRRPFTKKHLSSSVLLVIIVGALTVANSFLFLTANATYVEGSIKQDTVWTLVDSPIVISNNVTVNPGIKLTIEPGVQVKFGGEFSLIVEGLLIANGTQDRMITFTSNGYQPIPGDWNTILFSSQNASLLNYCIVAYAQTGITTINSFVDVRSSVISNNAQTGITTINGFVDVRSSVISNNDNQGISVVNSTATILSSQIANNSVSGICISGNNHATIQNNTIETNGDGILLNGTVSSGISISQNTVLSNTRSGIHFSANAYSGLSILNNVIVANTWGIDVTGSPSTDITNNTISYNNIGLFYEAGQDHEAHWNNIIDNVVGMNVSSSASTNATYNYWGDPSGPYNGLLNPAGKGNPVGGNSTNLGFIFWCTVPIGYVDHHPTAWLWADKKSVAPKQPVTFFATNSSNDRNGPVDMYLFDFGDGQNSGWTTLSVFFHEYNSIGTYDASVKVMDDFGIVSSNSASWTINCQTLPVLTASLVPSSPIVGSGGQTSITIHVTNSSSSVASASVTLFSIIGGSFSPSTGLTNSSGYFTSTFNTPEATQLMNIRIIGCASMPGYADGATYENLQVQPPLMVSLRSVPGTILSEASTNVTISVSYNGAPASGASVVVSSNSTGTFDSTMGVTSVNGSCTFVFTAPRTSIPIEINIVAAASESGYLGGQGHALLTVEPKVLAVQLYPNPRAIVSEMSSNVTVHVSYAGAPISDATVVPSSAFGSFSPINATSDLNGNCAFVFTASPVLSPTNITITATATRVGYGQGTNQSIIAVSLGTLSVQVTVYPDAVDSGASSQVTIHVTDNQKPVANASVNVSSASGGFAMTNGTTDANGDCVFTFKAPDTSKTFFLGITAKATKPGYLDGQGQSSITVNPASSPLSIWMIIAIIAIVSLVVVVLVLMKIKVIVLSTGGE